MLRFHSLLEAFVSRNTKASQLVPIGILIVCWNGTITKIPTSEENSKPKVPKKWQTQKHIKWMDTNSHIPDMVLACSYKENGKPNLVL